MSDLVHTDPIPVRDVAPIEEDARARAGAAQSLASDARASVWVAANAGTGKTKVLTDRVLRLLLNGAPPARLLCLTYTRAAAAEMANRIHAQLGTWASADDTELAKDLRTLLGEPASDELSSRARRLFARVLDTPGGLKIHTIHGFCQSLLRRFPIEAGVAPHFRVLDELDARTLLIDAQEHVLAALREDGAAGPDDALLGALAAVTERVHETRFAELMAGLIGARGRLADMLARCGGADGYGHALRARLGILAGETRESVLSAACADDAFDGVGLRAAAAAMVDRGQKTDQQRGAVIADWLAAPQQRPDGMESYLGAFFTDKGDRYAKLLTKALSEPHPEMLDTLHAEADRLEAVRAKLRAIEIATASQALMTLAAAIIAAYQARKAALGVLDYDDLILRSRALLAGREGEAQASAAAWVLFKLDGGIDHVLIDEAQDSNPDQWALVKALSEEFFSGLGAGAPADPELAEAPRTVFAVGDVKQSIYSFQGADPDAFTAERTRFATRVKAAHGDWREIPLTVSFRSTAPVLNAVDRVFALPEARAGVALDGAKIRHMAARAGHAGLVELWPALPVDEDDAPQPWQPPVERRQIQSARQRLALLIAQAIRDMVAGGERLESRGRPVEPGDILVLVRRRGGFVEELVRALKSVDIPVAGADRMKLTEQIAVMDLMAAGQACLLPDDDLTLACVLKGPLIGWSEERLFDLAHGRSGTLWAALQAHAGSDPHCAAALAALQSWRAKADYLRPYEFYADLLGLGGEAEAEPSDAAERPASGRARLIGRLGPQARDPIDEFLAQALAYERAHTPSLQGFLHWLETADLEVKREAEPTRSETVRIMTVHGAKGLQAPIVFLPDTLQPPSGSGRTGVLWDLDAPGGPLPLWSPRTSGDDPMASAARAAARDKEADEYRRLLYVALTRAEDRLYVCGWQTKKRPPADCWHELVRTALAPVAETVDDHPALVPGSDEAVLRLSAPQTAPPKAEPEQEGPLVAAGEPVPAFLTMAPPPEARPPRPLAPSRPDDPPPALSPLAEPGGTGAAPPYRRGLLVHRLLEILPELPPPDRAAAAKRFLTRPVHAVPEREADDIAQSVLSILSDPRFAPLFGPNSLAEVPIVGTVGDRVVSGRVDRLVVSEDSVLVVDYKSQRRAPERPEQTDPGYLRQMALYRALLCTLYPDRAVSCALLWVDEPSFVSLPDPLLDAFAPAG